MTKRASRPLAIATAVAAAALGAFAAPAPASAHWSCGRAAPPDVDTSGNHYTHEYDDSHTYVGSSLRCAVDYMWVGGYDVDYHCWTYDYASRDKTWTYIVTIGGAKRGWIEDSRLSDGGSTKRCPGDT